MITDENNKPKDHADPQADFRKYNKSTRWIVSVKVPTWLMLAQGHHEQANLARPTKDSPEDDLKEKFKHETHGSYVCLPLRLRSPGPRASRAGPQVCLKGIVRLDLHLLLPRTISTNLVYLLELIAFAPM